MYSRRMFSIASRKYYSYYEAKSMKSLNMQSTKHLVDMNLQKRLFSEFRSYRNRSDVKTKMGNLWLVCSWFAAFAFCVTFTLAENAPTKKPASGTVTYPQGDVYHGELKNGIPNGQGTLLYSSGAKYIGAFKNGLCHGEGILICSEGIREGMWEEGKMVPGGVLVNASDGPQLCFAEQYISQR